MIILKTQILQRNVKVQLKWSGNLNHRQTYTFLENVWVHTFYIISLHLFKF